MEAYNASGSIKCAVELTDVGQTEKEKYCIISLISGIPYKRNDWKRKWQPTPVFLPGEPHGQRSLAGHGPQGRRELDTTEVTKHACTKNDTNELSYKTERESET